MSMNYGYPQQQFNPMFNAQQRLNQLENQYQQFMPQQPMQNAINACYVTNLQEAQAQPVGLNATNIAIDNTNNKIYLKRMDNNGLADTKTYVPETVTATVNKPEQLNITKELEKFKKELLEEIKSLNDQTLIKKDKKNDK